MKKKYLCYQMIQVRRDNIGGINVPVVNIIIRNVHAKNENEAIGKFTKQTKDIKAVKKLEIECFLMKELKEIN